MNFNLSTQEDRMYTISIVSSKVVQPPPPPAPLEEHEEQDKEKEQMSEATPQPSIQELISAMETMREEFAAQLSAKEQAVTQVREQLSLQIKNISNNYDGIFSIVIFYIILQVGCMVFL